MRWMLPETNRTISWFAPKHPNIAVNISREWKNQDLIDDRECRAGSWHGDWAAFGGLPGTGTHPAAVSPGLKEGARRLRRRAGGEKMVLVRSKEDIGRQGEDLNYLKTAFFLNFVSLLPVAVIDGIETILRLKAFVINSAEP